MWKNVKTVEINTVGTDIKRKTIIFQKNLDVTKCYLFNDI